MRRLLLPSIATVSLVGAAFAAPANSPDAVPYTFALPKHAGVFVNPNEDGAIRRLDLSPEPDPSAHAFVNCSSKICDLGIATAQRSDDRHWNVVWVHGPSTTRMTFALDEDGDLEVTTEVEVTEGSATLKHKTSEQLLQAPAPALDAWSEPDQEN